jgi:hypothetical protein
VENGRATALVVHLRQRVYVLPWSLFLYAEGTDAEVKAQFHTHVVLVQGAGLTSLLSDVAGQFVKPARRAGPHSEIYSDRGAAADCRFGERKQITG